MTPQYSAAAKSKHGLVTAESRTGAGHGDRRPLRICHLAYTFYENDNRVIRYAEAAAERGDEVDVIALRRQGQKWRGVNNGVRVLRIQRRTVTERNPATYLMKVLWFFVKSMCMLSVRQFRTHYDLVHIHNVPDFLIFAALLPKLMGARLILDIHDILPELYAGKFGAANGSMVFRALLLAERLSCRFADHVIVSNDIWNGKLVDRTLAAEKVSTFLNYPDLRLFRPLQERRRPTDSFIMLYPGTLNVHQGLDVAIRAFALVHNQMPGAELHIYGEGPARSQLVQLAEELHLTDRVRILDRLPIEQISQVMAAADVGVVPKRAEGFGNEAFSTKILEFMACAVPVVASRTAIDSYYFDDRVVRFFTSGNEIELAAALLDVYGGRDKRLERVESARELALDYSWQTRVGGYRALIDTLVNSSLGAGSSSKSR